MLTRILTGIILGPLVLLLLVEGPEWAVATLFVTASALCLWELLTMLMPDRRLERWAGVVTGVGLQLSMYLEPAGILGDLVPLMVVPALAVLARPRPLDTAMVRLMTIWAGFVYVVLPFSFGIELATASVRALIVLLLALVWAGDTLAYFGGRAFGRHKLYPTVSPKKTIEGAICGLAGSVLVAALIAAIWIPGMSPVHGALIGLAGGAVAQMGDLVESLIKRSCGVKDSGTLLPGHGGMLDRVDGVIFAFPVVAALL